MPVGVPTYNYSWTPPQQTSVLTGLCAGDYTRWFRTAADPVQTQTFNIPGRVNLTFTDNVIPNNCFATAMVLQQFLWFYARIPFAFCIQLEQRTNGNWPFSSSVNNLCNGLYSVTAMAWTDVFRTLPNITSPTQLTRPLQVAARPC